MHVPRMGEGRLKDGGEPHLFHFSVTVQGAHADYVGEPFRLTVEAWSLSEACARAAEVPFPDWAMPPEEPPS